VDTKKWPLLAQFLIGLGVVGGLMNIGSGLAQKNIISIVFGLIGLVIYWNFYKFKNWALIGLNILLVLNIIVSLSGFLFLKPPYNNVNNRVLLLLCLITLIYSGLLLVYFNSRKIKGLLIKPEINSEGKI